MKILAQNQVEFNELVRTFKYLHDFTVWTKKFNWKFWQWYHGFFIYEGECLDLEGYPLLNSMVHLYRISHAHLEGNDGIEESKELKKLLAIDKTITNTFQQYIDYYKGDKNES